MDTNDFVEKLLSQVSLDTMDFASDVERLLAEQVVFLRERIHALRSEVVLEDHAIVRQLYERLAEKDEQIAHMRQEVQFLRSQLAA